MQKDSDRKSVIGAQVVVLKSAPGVSVPKLAFRSNDLT
jgi:hypothetical protein